MKIGKDDPILIIGASLSGLTTAVALRHYGYKEVHLYEKNPSLTEPNGVLFLGANAMHSLKSVQLAERVFIRGGAWNNYKLKWKNDKELKSYSLADIKEDTSFLPLSIPQQSYQEELISLIPDEYIHTGKEFISFTARDKAVEAHFADGDTIQGSLLVGADGADSRVHLQLMGEKKRKPINRMHYQVIIPEDHITSLSNIPRNEVVEIIGPGKGFLLAPLQNKDWVCQLSLEGSIAIPEGARKESFSQAFAKWPEPVETILNSIDPSAWHSFPLINQKIPRKWYDNRVILIGDAIHPIPLNWHMGADLSVESAVLLGRLLAEEGNLKRAFRQFEKKRVSRVKRFKKASTSRGAVMYSKKPLSWFLRNAIVPGLPAERGFSALMKLNKGDYYEGK